MNAQPSRDDFNLDASRDTVGAYPRTALQEAVNNDAAEEYGKLAFTLLDRENFRNFHLMEEINRERARRDLEPFPISYPVPDNGQRRRRSDKPQEDKPAEGIDAVLIERGKRYGSYQEKAHIIQHIKGILRSASSWEKMDADMKESLDNVVQKIGRIVTGDPEYLDSWTDVIGYTKLVEDRLKGVQR